MSKIQQQPAATGLLVHVSLTARDIIQKIAKELDYSYRDIALRVNEIMQEGVDIQAAIERITKEHKLDFKKFQLKPIAIANEIKRILQEDYTQTLMISAVLAQMVETKGREHLPIPAFFAFMEILSQVPNVLKDHVQEGSTEVDERTTRIIELLTTLVSVICDWSAEGLTGISPACPESLQGMARAIFRKNRMLQSGLWTCISCGKIVDVSTTHALMCSDCDSKISGDFIPREGRPERRERVREGYGKSSTGDTID
jgi:hypothetical protein